MSKKPNGKYTYRQSSHYNSFQKQMITIGIAILVASVVITTVTFIRHTLYINNELLVLKHTEITTDTQSLTRDIEDFLFKKNIAPGKVTLTQMNLGELRKNILKAFPLIENLKITRKFPDTLVLTITERKAVATLRHVDTKTQVVREWKVDKTGIVLPRTVPSPEGIPIVNGISHPELLIPGEKTTNRGVLAFLAFLKEKALRPEGGIYEVTICRLDEANEELTLVLNAKGPFTPSSRIILPQDNISKTLDNLQVIVKLRLENNQTISYINATFENIPVRP